MKRKKALRRVIWVIVITFIVFCFPGNEMETVKGAQRNASGQGIVQLSSEKGQPKVISVVLDNSSSMVRTDGTKEPTTRWIEADYAVKALAAMMDTDDILRLYIMSGYRNDVKTRAMADPEEIKIGEAKEEAVKAVEDYLESMRVCNYTYYNGVTRAAEDMRPYLDEGRECWIVILTDGTFWEPGQPKMEAETLTRNLYAITEQGMDEDGCKIKIAYIPIGDIAETAEIKEDIVHGIYVAATEKQDSSGTGEGEEGQILKKVTDIINQIYGRVRLKEIAVKERYLAVDEQGIHFYFDIPLEKLIVFMQHSGPEEKYEAYRQRQSDSQSPEGSGIQIDIGSPSVPKQLIRSDVADFRGRDTLPEYEDGEPGYKLNEVRYKELWGKMLSYTKRGSSGDSVKETEELMIPVNGDSNPDVEVYYQPAIKVGLEYIQNGESVRHIEGCHSDEGGEEYCLQEGEVTVRINLLDDKGNEIVKKNSDLIYKDQINVYLQAVEEKEWELMTPTGRDYEFEGYLAQQDYQIMVVTPWGEQKTGVLKVQERRKELEIILPDVERVVLNDPEEDSGLIAVYVEEEGEIPREEIIGQMTVECICQDETLSMVPVESGEAGKWLFAPTLQDPRSHTVTPEVQLQISASRPYAIGEPETANAEMNISVASYPEELLITLESETAVNVMSSLLWPFGAERVPLKYVCRDILDEEEKARVINQDVLVEPDSIAPYISIGKDGDIHIERSFIKWFFTNEVSAEITFHAAYNLLNTQNEADIVIHLEFATVPTWMRYLIGALTLLILTWIIAILIRNSTYRFMHRFHARLLADVETIYELKQDRIRHLLDPTCNYCLLLYENGKHVEDPIMPDLRMKIRNDRLSAGYEIVNYTEFLDADRYAINGNPINEDNRSFDDVKKFSVKDKKDVRFHLIIER